MACPPSVTLRSPWVMGRTQLAFQALVFPCVCIHPQALLSLPLFFMARELQHPGVCQADCPHLSPLSPLITCNFVHHLFHR